MGRTDKLNGTPNGMGIGQAVEIASPLTLVYTKTNDPVYGDEEGAGILLGEACRRRYQRASRCRS
jgi:hypothetical protein